MQFSPSHAFPTSHKNHSKQNMEALSIQTKHFTSLLFYLSISSLFLSPPSQATTTPSGTIQRATKQQILASIPPTTEQNSQPFITSPSGKYSAYFLRRETALGAGSFGNDFCYIQIQDTSSEQSVWESKCAPVSNANTCTLVFSDAGLEVFDGSNSVWDADVDGDHLENLELVDEGDMRIREKGGELAWKASDEPLANQRCGSPGSPGLGAAKPPFASPIGGGGNLPFGQQQQQQQQQQPQAAVVNGQDQQQQQQQQPQAAVVNGQDQQQQQPLNGVNQPFGFMGQPLVDNTPFDSGCLRGVECSLGMEWALILALVAYGFIL